jgi:hypothetical protein
MIPRATSPSERPTRVAAERRAELAYDRWHKNPSAANRRRLLAAITLLRTVIEEEARCPRT